MSFGSKVRLCRKALQLTQEQLADRAGLTKQVVSLYEKDERTPKVNAAAKCADALNVPLKYLVSEKIDMRLWEYDDELEDYWNASIPQRLAIVAERGIDPRIALNYDLVSSIAEGERAVGEEQRGEDEVTRKLLDFVDTATADELRQLLDFIAYLLSRRNNQ